MEWPWWPRCHDRLVRQLSLKCRTFLHVCRSNPPQHHLPACLSAFNQASWSPWPPGSSRLPWLRMPRLSPQKQPRLMLPRPPPLCHQHHHQQPLSIRAAMNRLQTPLLILSEKPHHHIMLSSSLPLAWDTCNSQRRLCHAQSRTLGSSRIMALSAGHRKQGAKALRPGHNPRWLHLASCLPHPGACSHHCRTWELQRQQENLILFMHN